MSLQSNLSRVIATGIDMSMAKNIDIKLRSMYMGPKIMSIVDETRKELETSSLGQGFWVIYLTRAQAHVRNYLDRYDHEKLALIHRGTTFMNAKTQAELLERMKTVSKYIADMYKLEYELDELRKSIE